MNSRASIGVATALCMLTACNSSHGDDTFVTDAAKLRPSVVLVSTRLPPETQRGAPEREYATGTVVASGPWGSDVLTVQHAIEGALDLHLTIGNEQKVPAHVIAQNSDLDLALLRTPRANLPVARLGRSDSVQPGRQVGLVGYPIPDQFEDMGFKLDTSLASGQISSLRRDAVEVTLAIVPGESGAPIFLTDDGEIIGMAESRFDPEHSIGLALPVDDERAFLHAHDARHGF